MKKLIILLIMGFGLTFNSCDNDNVESDFLDDGRILHTTQLVFNGCIDHFDALTRAVTSDWADGAKLYIKFSTASGIVDGVATYRKNAEMWEVQNYGTLTKELISKCEIFFFDKPQSTTMNSVVLSAQTAVFTDSQASYLYKDGVIILTAHLKPLTGRLRFRGMVGQQVTFSGLKWYSGYDITTNTLSTKSSEMTLTVASDGYTPYVYARFADVSTPQITVNGEDEDYFFRKIFNNSVLVSGKSGYLDIPTITSRNGWLLVEVEKPDPLGLCPTDKHPHSIDMGRGLKWSCCNVGAKSPVEYGGYFAWGETKTKSIYNWSTYAYCRGTKTSLTKYCMSSSYGVVDNKNVLDFEDDAARVNWGGTWRMPSVYEFSKLISDCTWTWTTISGVKGYKVKASNGNTLFFPAADSKKDGSQAEVGCNGYYWCSDRYSIDYDAYVLYFHSASHTTAMFYRSFGHSVRPVTK